MLKHAFLFDLDGTLLLDQNSPIQHFLTFCERLGHPFNGDTSARLTRWQHEYWSKQHQVEADLAEHGHDKFWIAYNVKQLEFLNVSGPVSDYASLIDRWFQEEYFSQPIVPDDVRPTLTHLRDSGAVLGLVSNRNHPLATVVEEHLLTDLFHFTLSAGEAQSWKPSPGIFNAALQLAGVAAAEAVYVGDNYFADVVGARNAGLTPVLIDRQAIFPEADCKTIQTIDELRGF